MKSQPPPRPRGAATRRLTLLLAASLQSLLKPPLLGVAPLLPRAASAAERVRGAAELDAEFYLRSAFGRQTSKQPQLEPPAPARALAPLGVAMLDAAASSIAASLAIPVAELRQRAAARLPRLSVEFERALTLGAFGNAYASSFGAGGGGGGGTPLAATLSAIAAGAQPPTDQFQLDLALLALFSVLSDERLPRAELGSFSTKLGDALLGIVAPPAATAAPPQGGGSSASPPSAAASAPRSARSRLPAT